MNDVSSFSMSDLFDSSTSSSNISSIIISISFYIDAISSRNAELSSPSPFLFLELLNNLLVFFWQFKGVYHLTIPANVVDAKFLILPNPRTFS